MTPVLLLAIAGLVVFLAAAAWSVRSAKQPLTSIDSFSRALEAMGPDGPSDDEREDGEPVRAPTSSPHDEP